MGCGASVNKDPNAGHPAVKDNWPLKDEAIRIFKLADLDGNECLDSEELAKTLKKPQFVDTAMANYDLNMDGKVSRSEWLIAIKNTFDKSEAGAKTTLKSVEKCLLANKEA